jgi:phage FluMu protein Com
VKDARHAPSAERELRCGCGSLMARLTADGLELKCRRCKRLVVVPVPSDEGEWVEVSMR